MRPHTIEDIEYDLSLLWEKESEGITQAALARREGMSEGHLSRRLARARRHRVELLKQELESCDGYDDEGTDELPYLAITDDPAREARDWYEPESGLTSLDRIDDQTGNLIVGTGRVRIGNHNGTRLLVRSINGGRKTEEAIKQHQPDPEGLKGGVG